MTGSYAPPCLGFVHPPEFVRSLGHNDDHRVEGSFISISSSGSVDCDHPDNNDYRPLPTIDFIHLFIPSIKWMITGIKMDRLPVISFIFMSFLCHWSINQ
jgi:hypothetical protein